MMAHTNNNNNHNKSSEYYKKNSMRFLSAKNCLNSL